MHVDAACEPHFQTEGKHFKFPICTRILHGCPKFKPTNDPIVLDEDEEGEEKKVAAQSCNPVASVQGRGVRQTVSPTVSACPAQLH